MTRNRRWTIEQRLHRAAKDQAYGAETRPIVSKLAVWNNFSGGREDQPTDDV